jgi:hypothetical protein
MCIICNNKTNINYLIKQEFIDCSDCKYIDKIPSSLVFLQKLICKNCPLLKVIPPTLVNLHYLECDNCTALEIIPETLINLEVLYCNNCTSLKSISSNFNKLKKLICSNCPNIHILPIFSELELLDCSDCKAIEEISDLNTFVQKLICNNCPSLKHIPSTLIKLYHLECKNCDSLKSLPSTFKLLEVLNCTNCPLINKIHFEFQNLEILSCLNCPKIVTLPTFENLQQLECNPDIFETAKNITKLDYDHTNEIIYEHSLSYQDCQKYRRKKWYANMQNYRWPRQDYDNNPIYLFVFNQFKHMWTIDDLWQLWTSCEKTIIKQVLYIVHSYCEFEEAGIIIDHRDSGHYSCGMLCLSCPVGKWVEVDYQSKDGLVVASYPFDNNKKWKHYVDILT